MRIYWDYSGHRFLDYISSTGGIDLFKFSLRDRVPLEIIPIALDVNSEFYAETELPDGTTPKCQIKKTANRGDPALAEAMTWVKDGNSYRADLLLSGSGLVAAVEAETANQYLDLVIEITRQDVSLDHRDSTRAICRIENDVIRAGEAEPTNVESHPWFREVVVDGKKCLQVFNSDGELLVAFGPPGVTP
jgi:hypothetical protein